MLFRSVVKVKEEERKEILRSVVKEWNSLVISLLKVKSSWDRYSKICIENQVSIEEFPLESQKTLMKANPKGDFDLIIEDMVTQGKQVELFLKTQFIKL